MGDDVIEPEQLGGGNQTIDDGLRSLASECLRRGLAQVASYSLSVFFGHFPPRIRSPSLAGVMAS